jgi:SP family general alpha glucoside:H+ symporter-like MFS transporter
MSSGVLEHEVENKSDAYEAAAHVDIKHSGVLGNVDLMHDAVDGENREHETGVWAAVKGHPWACFWAFIMCFTIVSGPRIL